MSATLSTGFENGLTGGLGFDSANTITTLIQDDTEHHAGGTYSMKLVATTGGVNTLKTISQSTITGRFYLRFQAVPVGGQIMVAKFTVDTHDFHFFVFPSGRLQVVCVDATSNRTLSTVMSANTWYLVDFLFDVSASTWTADVQLSLDTGETTATLLETAAQVTRTGMTASTFTAARLGQMQGSNFTCWFDDATLDDASDVYPIGPGVSSDGTNAPITDYPPSWLDDPTLIQGGILFGLTRPSPAADDTEGPLFANRTNYIVESFYQNVTTIQQLSLEKAVQNGRFFGHQAWPMIHPFGFSAPFTTNWPTGGLASFADGTMDTIIDAWGSTMQTQLGATPFMVRPFREMNSPGVIYGSNGAAHGGLNESPATLIAAWQRVVTRIRAKCSTARFVWCIGMTHVDPIAGFDWYPGDAYVDWIGTDIYAELSNSYDMAPTIATWYAGYNPVDGSLGTQRPLMICETFVNANDANRISDFGRYTHLFDAYPEVRVVVFYSDRVAYRIDDATPPGFLSAFQGIVGSPPYTGMPNRVYDIHADHANLYVWKP